MSFSSCAMFSTATSNLASPLSNFIFAYIGPDNINIQTRNRSREFRENPFSVLTPHRKADRYPPRILFVPSNLYPPLRSNFKQFRAIVDVHGYPSASGYKTYDLFSGNRVTALAELYKYIVIPFDEAPRLCTRPWKSCSLYSLFFDSSRHLRRISWGASP